MEGTSKMNAGKILIGIALIMLSAGLVIHPAAAQTVSPDFGVIAHPADENQSGMVNPLVLQTESGINPYLVPHMPSRTV